MIFAVVDTETTGLGTSDQVCEVAVVYVPSHGERVPKPWSTFVRPTVPVSLEARAVHHISDEELANAPTMAEVLESHGGVFPRRSARSKTVLCAHNAAFDRRMLLQSGVPERVLPPSTVCTLRLARSVFPDAPSHSNQVLRYYLGLDVTCDLPPHRALADATVTAHILLQMLLRHPAEELLERANHPALLSVCRVGKKYRDVKFADIGDAGYLEWLTKSDFDDDVRYTARYWLERRRQK